MISYMETKEQSGSLQALVAALGRFSAAVAAKSMEAWLGLNLTMPQFHALRAIWRQGEVSGKQLARELGVSAAAVVKVCDKLEAAGYVERVRDTKDRRIWRFQLTSKAVEVFETLTILKRSRIGPALADLSDTDRANLTRLLDTLSDRLGSQQHDALPRRLTSRKSRM